jgi:hypothetical protein
MKKPRGEFGLGVRLSEMQASAKSLNHMLDTDYVGLMFRAALEKLECIKRAKTMVQVRGILRRAEWVD